MEQPKVLPPHKYDAVFWVEVDRIHPNPYQPRREFDEEKLKALAESIRQYGVLQPLVVTRREVDKEEGGLQATYELLAGERRLRASKLIGLREVPVVIRQGEETGRMKLEIAIIENLQREDLNAIDRAKAFRQLIDEFGLSHAEVGARMGKSREYVSNTLRLLNLPEHMQNALVAGEIMEGHTRPLLMLTDRKEEQEALYRDIQTRKISVRESELIARKIAVERARKHDMPPEMRELEQQLAKTLGTRVHIKPELKGGKILIDFFSKEDLEVLVSSLTAPAPAEVLGTSDTAESVDAPLPEEAASPTDAKEDEDLYAVRSFSL